MLRKRKSADRSMTRAPRGRISAATEAETVCGSARKTASTSTARICSIFPKITFGSIPRKGGNACSTGWSEYCSEVSAAIFTLECDSSRRMSSNPVYPVAPYMATLVMGTAFPVMEYYLPAGAGCIPSRTFRHDPHQRKRGRRHRPSPSGTVRRAKRPARLPLGELEPFPRPRSSVLFPFLDSGVPRQVPRALERRPELGVRDLQRLGQPVFERVGLGRGAAARDVDFHVDALPLPREDQRLHRVRPQREHGEVLLELPAVHLDPPAARSQVDARDGGFPLARCIDPRLCHSITPFPVRSRPAAPPAGPCGDDSGRRRLSASGTAG